ncbi:MAG: hypothetical protein QME12_06565 [Nanoarchaeota archaeon]|nr:hypothetical protein [Nanoarchaeota archaeon]
MNRQALIGFIKQKREFRDLDNKFVEKMLDSRLKGKKVEDLKPRDAEKMEKETRACLREVYGAFLTPKFFQREKFLHKLKSLNDTEGHIRILSLHLSTRERLPYYREIYQKIFAVTGEPSSILDLGCGLNPFSLPFMNLKDVRYYAVELAKPDADFIQRYFDKFKINGKAINMDLTEAENLPSADVCFMFKVIDTFEAIQWDVTAELMAKIKAKWIVAGFATKSLGGRKMIKPEKRQWFEKLIANRNYSVFEVENEVFYIIEGFMQTQDTCLRKLGFKATAMFSRTRC